MKVPFGKYKDKEINELLNDKNYFNWCIKEKIFNQFKTKDPQFFEEINKHIIKPKKIKIVEEKKQCPNLGALIQNTETYVLAEKADKNVIYVCPDCGDKLFLKKGEIRVAHFSHYKKDNPCTYYTHPSESQIHKDAKLLLKYLLENKKVCIKQDCIKCKVIKNFNIEEKNDNVDIKLEYKFNLNDKIKFADVGYAMDGKLKYIFEIYNTHLTKESDRPEPWFEIEAKGLINNYKDENNDVNINCIRKKKCFDCIEKKRLLKENIEKKVIKLNKEYINNKPKLFLDAKYKLVNYLNHRVEKKKGAWIDYPITECNMVLDEVFIHDFFRYHGYNYIDSVDEGKEKKIIEILPKTKQFHSDWIPTFDSCVEVGYKSFIVADIVVPVVSHIREIWFINDGTRTDIKKELNNIIEYNRYAKIYSINPNIVMMLFDIDFNNIEKCKETYNYIVKNAKLLHEYKYY